MGRSTGSRAAFIRAANVAALCTAWTCPASVATATDQGDAIQVTFGVSADNPDWSPDGSEIAFDSPHLGNSRAIWVIPATGGTPRLIVSGSEPAWSPAGTHIAYHVFSGGIWVVEVGNPHLPSTRIIDRGSSPTWSPDGGQLAYEWGGDIWVTPATGGTATQITSGNYDLWPAWSPDGNQLAFSRWSGVDFFFDLWVIPATGGTAVRIPSAVGDEATWSPDGNMIATRVGGPHVLVFSSANGAFITRFVWCHGSGCAEAPDWSPNGSHIAVASNEAIWVARAPTPPIAIESESWGGIKAKFYAE